LKHPDPNPCDPPLARPEAGGSSPAGAGHCEGRAIYRKTFTPPICERNGDGIREATINLLNQLKAEFDATVL